MGPSRQLDRVFTTALDAGATDVFLDRPYVDLDFCSDLSHFYSRAFRPPPPATERLIFTNEQEVVGATVIRPIPGYIALTVMCDNPISPRCQPDELRINTAAHPTTTGRIHPRQASREVGYFPGRANVSLECRRP